MKEENIDYQELDTTVVSIDNFSFKHLQEKLEYAYPGEKRKIFDYFAFYRVSPISAITHYGKVKNVIKDAFIKGKYRLLCFGDKARKSATKVVFDKIVKLDNPVKSSGNYYIQGMHYTKMEYIKNAKTIKDLLEMKKD